MTAASSSGLRSRKVDPKRTMAVIRFDQVDELERDSMINTMIPQAATGVEKEEEEEHHLQQALVANQGYQVVIPTPDASVLANLPNYEKYYTATFHIPKSLIKYSQLVEEVIGCLYDLTDKDLLFLHALDKDQREKLTDDEFEKIMFILDEMNFSKVGDPTIDELATEIETNAIQQEKESLQLVLDYYLGLSKKKNTPRLRPVLKNELESISPDNDPYVCFRQREIKSFRKVRRSDTLAFEKIQKLKHDMARAKEMLDLVNEREKNRMEMLNVERLIFQERVYLRKLRKHFKLNQIDNLDNSPDQKTRKKSKRGDGSTKIRIPMQSLKDASHLVSDLDPMFDDRIMSADHRIEEKIRREKALNDRSGWYDCTESPYKLLPQQKLWGQHLGQEVLKGTPFVHMVTRRRVGRGGRVMFDRFAYKDRTIEPTFGDTSNLDPPEILLNQTGPERTLFRAFRMPPKEEQLPDLQNRPVHLHPFDATKYNPKDHLLPTPQIIRAPVTQPAVKKKPKLSDTKPSTNSTKKKGPEVVDARQMAVKTMMKQAQQQAQQNQIQVQQTQSPDNFQQQKLYQQIPQGYYYQRQGSSTFPQFEEKVELSDKENLLDSLLA